MPARKSTRITVIAALFLALFAGSGMAQESKGGAFTKIPTVKGIEPLKLGTSAPDFSVPDLNGKEFRLKDYKGKEAVLLFFWSFFCGPCREEIPLVNATAQSYKDKGIEVVGVNLDGREMKKAIVKFVENEKIAFRIVFDELDGDTFRIADPYGVAGTPTLFLIDRKGTIVFRAIGAVTADQLRSEVQKIVK